MDNELRYFLVYMCASMLVQLISIYMECGKREGVEGIVSFLRDMTRMWPGGHVCCWQKQYVVCGIAVRLQQRMQRLQRLRVVFCWRRWGEEEGEQEGQGCLPFVCLQPLVQHLREEQEQRLALQEVVVKALELAAPQAWMVMVLVQVVVVVEEGIREQPPSRQTGICYRNVC